MSDFFLLEANGLRILEKAIPAFRSNLNNLTGLLRFPLQSGLDRFCLL